LGTNPIGVSVTPDGRRAYIANRGSSNTSVIDTTTNTVVKTIPVGSLVFRVAITPNGTRVYVANNGSNNTVVANFPVGLGPAGVAIGP
jgi:YVTN family beta-propeller protein